MSSKLYGATGVLIDKEITIRQRKFAEYFMTGMTASAAAVKAGYSNKSAYTRGKELTNNPRVAYYMSERLDKLQKKLEIPLEYLLGKLKHVVDSFIPDGSDLEKDKVSVGLSAIRELNQIQGNYAAEKRINVNVDGDKHLERIKELTEKAIEENKREY
jgi:phage terminase small subunit